MSRGNAYPLHFALREVLSYSFHAQLNGTSWGDHLKKRKQKLGKYSRFSKVKITYLDENGLISLWLSMKHKYQQPPIINHMTGPHHRSDRSKFKVILQTFLVLANILSNCFITFFLSSRVSKDKISRGTPRYWIELYGKNLLIISPLELIRKGSEYLGNKNFYFEFKY